MHNRTLSIVWSVAFVTVLGLAFLAQPTQAQTFTVIHNFTGGQDRANPGSGVTLDKADGGRIFSTLFTAEATESISTRA
jgi:hypothetical protein